jgi:hypothetical protein
MTALAALLFVDAHQLLPLRRREQRADLQHAAQAHLVKLRLRRTDALRLAENGPEIRYLLIEKPSHLVVQGAHRRLEAAAFVARSLGDLADLRACGFVEPEAIGISLEEIGRGRGTAPLVACIAGRRQPGLSR